MESDEFSDQFNIDELRRSPIKILIAVPVGLVSRDGSIGHVFMRNIM